MDAQENRELGHRQCLASRPVIDRGANGLSWTAARTQSRRKKRRPRVCTQLVANAPNDGYTVLIADTPFAANHSIYAKAGYDPIKSFTPITQLATTPLMLVINPSLPAASVQDFIQTILRR